MYYENIQEAIFLERPNRFIAHIAIDGTQEIAHVKNTGRCKELLTNGCKIYVQHFDSDKRKTKYDLINVVKNNLLINMDSQAPNKVVQEWLEQERPFGEIIKMKPEYTCGKSRFDFYLELPNKKMFIEVKGVTLEENGVVLFPDAPTERGLKHVEELIRLKKQGFEAAIIFVVQMENARYFTPNRKTQPAFADALQKARDNGVQVLAYTCHVSKNSLGLAKALEVKI